MTSQTSVTRHWLSLRIRLVCIGVFVAGSFLPPYVPRQALATEETSLESQQFLLVEDGFLMKTSPLTSRTSRRTYAEGRIHTVKEGESLEKLSSRYVIGIDTIRWANGLEAGQPIQPGQELLILPVDGVLHTVSRGQNLTRIAELYSVDSARISEQNKLEGGFITQGQELIIPGGSPIIAKPVEVAAVPPAVKPPEPGKPPVQPARPPAEKAEPVAPKAEPTLGVLQRPCGGDCFYTQYYRPGHYAVDMQVKGGAPIYAAEGGTVTRAAYGWNGGYGNVIEIDHGNGLITLYGHNKELYVKEGDAVERGQNIAFMGNTGLVYGKTGIHVHFEVIVNGVKKNPMLYLE